MFPLDSIVSPLYRKTNLVAQNEKERARHNNFIKLSGCTSCGKIRVR